MKFISQVSSMPPPEEWIENKIECKILGKILYQWKIGEAECEKYWLMIVRDDDYNYYNITTATPKEMYQKFHESPDGKGPVTVTHETCLKSSKIPLSKDISYYFTIRKFYIQENFAIKIGTEKKSIWEKLPWCKGNLIDSKPQETQKIKLITNNIIEENKINTNSANSQNILGITLGLVSIICILLFIYIMKNKFGIYKKISK